MISLVVEMPCDVDRRFGSGYHPNGLDHHPVDHLCLRDQNGAMKDATNPRLGDFHLDLDRRLVEHS